MRMIVIGISLFWVVDFSMSGLSRAVPSPYDHAPGIFSLVHTHHLFGFAAFGIAALFLLSVLFSFSDTHTAERDAGDMLAAAVTGALMLTAATHAFDWAEGRVDTGVFVEAGLLVLTGMAGALRDRRTTILPADQAATFSNDYLRDRIAAATASVQTLSDARPRS